MSSVSLYDESEIDAVELLASLAQGKCGLRFSGGEILLNSFAIDEIALCDRSSFSSKSSFLRTAFGLEAMYTTFGKISEIFANLKLNNVICAAAPLIEVGGSSATAIFV